MAKIDSLTLCGFRCFASDGQSIDFDDMTSFVGPNASGKTAAMSALARLFGDTPSHRRIVPSDFHLVSGEQLKDKSPRSLYIECRLGFPELEGDSDTLGDAVPTAFNQMIVDQPGGTPYCRIRLDSTWTDDGTSSGDIEQTLSWIITDSNDLSVIDDGHRRRVQPSDRAKIRAIYVPASRDPEHQLQGTTATVFGRLIRAIEWNGVDAAMKVKLAELQQQLGSLKGLTSLNTHVQDAWAQLYRGRVAGKISFQAIDDDPTSFVDLLAAVFQPGDDGRRMATSDLSDGLRSLFSLSLSLGLFAVEQSICAAADVAGFKAELAEDLPVLTVFAVEEPENHLSPHYLGHVIKRLNAISLHPSAQVVLSSHSPSILGRVAPDNVRYFLGTEQAEATSIRPLPLPADPTDESFKYVREAIRGFPELYFASLVVLGEGASEEIVLKHVFEISGTPVDSNFISIVPLGGRHVNHFWRLLNGLGIPYLTLLDLDREKDGAGWGRIQYVRDQLVSLHGAHSPLLQWQADNGTTESLANVAYDTLASNDVSDIAKMDGWIAYYQERFNVFFSKPLDLDFALLEAFPDVYKGLVVPPRRGPTLPPRGSAEYPSAIDVRVRQVLAENLTNPPPKLGSTYTPAQHELFPWYKYLFLDDSKPVAHMRAMLQLNAASLAAAPSVLLALVQRARTLLQPPTTGV